MRARFLDEGTVLGGDFRVIAPLDEGGMGAVYVALQLSTGKNRALKVMHPELLADRALRDRFEQEARIGARIRSDHVVDVVAAGVDAEAGVPYLVMELLEGQSLRKRMTGGEPVPREEVRLVFEQLCHAVGAAHAASIVHRDLKPENVFLAHTLRAGGPPLFVKVLDFGIAKLVAEAGPRTSTGAMGSPLWMAPEQTERGAVTPAADVWALGLIAFEMITGKTFWLTPHDPTGTTGQLMREILVNDVPPASERARELGRADVWPQAFDAWFAGCTARDPRARFADAHQAWLGMQPMFAPLSLASTAYAATEHAATGPAPPPSPRGVTEAASPSGPSPSARSREMVPPMAPQMVGPGPAASGATPLAVEAPPRKRRGPFFYVALVIGVVVILPALRRIVRIRHEETLTRDGADGTGRSTSGHAHARGGGHAAEEEDDPDLEPAEPEEPAPPPDDPSSPARADGFQDPSDDARLESAAAAVILKVGTRDIRLFTRVLKNKTPLSDEVVRAQIDADSWRYLDCYSRGYATLKVQPPGIVRVAVDVHDRLPQRVALESSSFDNPSVGECVKRVVIGHTINVRGAASADGGSVGRVSYAFRFLPSD